MYCLSENIWEAYGSPTHNQHSKVLYSEHNLVAPFYIYIDTRNRIVTTSAPSEEIRRKIPVQERHKASGSTAFLRLHLKVEKLNRQKKFRFHCLHLDTSRNPSSCGELLAGPRSD